MYNRLTLIEQLTAIPLVSPYYEELAFNLPLNAANKANALFSDRYDYLNYMYVGTTASNGYVLGNIVPHVSGMTYSLTGTDAARFAISATGVITLTNNSGLVAGTLSFNVVHNLLGTIPISVPVVSPSSAVAFFDSVNGNDANSGRQPHLPKLTLDVSLTGYQATNCIRRGSTYNKTIRFGNNNNYRAYGDPSAPRPILTAPSPEVANAINYDKAGGGLQGCSNVLIEDLDFRGGSTVERCVVFSNVTNCTIKRCSARGNIEGSNSQAYWCGFGSIGLIIRHCDATNYNGDGIYVTSTTGTNNDIAFNHIHPTTGGVADCIQITGENNFSQRPKNFWVRYNIFDYGVRTWTGVGKGSAVVQETDGFCFEYNFCKGGYFGIGSMGSRGTIRYNMFYDCRFLSTANNEWGMGYGADQYAMQHAYYGNIVNASNRGAMIGGYGSPAGGWQRVDTEIQYNTIINCGNAGYANQPWTGLYQKNIFVNNYAQSINETGNGLNIANVTGTMTITQTGGVATAVCTPNHTMGVGDTFTAAGANEAGYNGSSLVIVSTPTANTFTYAVNPATATPATGTITYQKNRKYTTKTINNTAQSYLGSTIATAPTISGTCQNGQTVTVATTAQTGITYTYQWLLNGIDISGATSASYTIPAGTSTNTNILMNSQNNTAQLSCVVIATNAAGMISYEFALWDTFTAFKNIAA